MKNFLALIAIFLFIIGCGESVENNNSEEALHSEEYQDEEVIEDANAHESEWTEVLVCNIGIYQEIAVMVLNYYPPNSNDIANVDGYYFYVKHQKDLDLEGTEEILYQNVYLTEYYKGEETGYMEFNLREEAAINYWAPSPGSDDHQEFNAKRILEGTPDEYNVALQKYNFERQHSVGQYNSETNEFDPEDVTDELHACLINDTYLVFDYHVIRTNFHLGSISGIAELQEDGNYVWIGEEDFQLTFTFEKNSILITEDNYIEMYYGGANVHFDGVLDQIND